MRSRMRGQRGDLYGLACLGITLAGAFAIGSYGERQHFKRLEAAERELAYIPVTDLRIFTGEPDPRVGGMLLTAEVVMGTDYFKNFIASFKKIIGGELTLYLSLMERARREAVVRLKREAQLKGFNAIANMRLETASVGGKGNNADNSKNMPMIAIMAYGTGYRTQVLKDVQVQPNLPPV